VEGRRNRLANVAAELPADPPALQGHTAAGGGSWFCAKERTPWAQTVRTCQQLLLRKEALWTFLEVQGIEPTNNAAERALRQSVIQRKISLGVQSASGAICRSRLLTVTTTLRQQGRDTWQFLEQAWIAHHRGGVMPSLLPGP
jgi:transposase